jgi:hypothetical protein
MEEQLDYTEINSLVKDFLVFNKMNGALSTFESEIRDKVMSKSSNITQVNRTPRNERELL